MPDTNIEMLQIVAKGLEELKDRVVFVGGAVAELYASDSAASEIRATKDVDCVIELSSRYEHAILEEKLRAKGFKNDISKDAPICRLIYRNIKVDVMPTDESILGFSNRWYIEGIKKKITKDLPDGTKVFLFPVEYYLAAKFEAHKGREGDDLRQSRDFEDIIYIMDNCIELMDRITNADPGIKIYLKEECLNLLENNGLTEGIGTALPIGSSDESKEIIEGLIQSISEFE